MDWQAHWQAIILWAGLLSLLLGVLTLLAVPWVITRLPADYFSRARRDPLRQQARRPLVALLFTLLKNALGLVLAALGIIMLVTPGQGLLTLLVGLLLMNFPGKYRLERWLVSRPGLLRGMNWLRRRSGKEPLLAPLEKTP